MDMSQSKPPAAVEDLSQQDQEHQLTRADSILGRQLENVTNEFKIGKEIGSGRSSVTKICRKKSTGKKYACKSIPKRRLVTENEKEDLKREVKILELLKGQTNVVQLEGIYKDNENLNLVMEYCEGGDLYGKMVSKGGCGYSEKIAALILSSIMKVVYSLHYMDVMHRDLKPENFMLAKRGVFGFLPCLADYSQLKAIDFRLSVYIDEDKPNREKVGTAFYIAPEVLRRQPYGKEVDIWSAGVILYMLLTGVPPFPGDNEKEIFEAILNAKPDTKNCPWPLKSEKARELVEKMLSVDPKKRPTAAAVLNDQWMKDNGVATENPVDMRLLDKMKSFRARNKFRKFALKIMTEAIPPEELEELKAMFRNYYKDGKKVVSSEKLEKSLFRIGSNLEADEAKQIVKNADKDDNGFIDEEEFLTAINHFKEQHKDKQLGKAFHHFDRDNNGLISKEELKSALEENIMGDEFTIEEIISEIDVNKDGGMNYKEFCALISS